MVQFQKPPSKLLNLNKQGRNVIRQTDSSAQGPWALEKQKHGFWYEVFGMELELSFDD